MSYEAYTYSEHKLMYIACKSVERLEQMVIDIRINMTKVIHSIFIPKICLVTD
jgi:hypothetical protein